MRFGKVAILLTVAAAALRCSGNPPVSEPGQAPLTAPSAVVINGIDHSATPSGTEVVLHGNYPFSYTSYQPDPRTLVLELLDVHVQGVGNEVQIGTPQVAGVRVSSVESVDGGTIAKFEFNNVLASQHAIRLEGNDLIIDFPTLGQSGSAPEPPLVAQEVVAGEESASTSGEPQATSTDQGTVPKAGAENAALEPLPSPAEGAAGATTTASSELKPVPGSTVPAGSATSAATPSSGPAPQTAPKPAAEPVHVTRGPVPAGNAAKALLSVESGGADPEPVVVLKADGPLAQEHFELKNPPRLVIDLIGVVDKTPNKLVPISSAILSKVRVAQFATRPRPVARVVLDLSVPKPYAIVPTDTGLVVDFSEEAVRHAAESAPAAPARTQSTLAAETPVTAEAAPAGASEQPPVEPSGEPAKASAKAAAETAAPQADETAETTAPSAPQDPLLASGEAKVNTAAPREVSFKPAASDRQIMISNGVTRYGTRSISDNGPRYTGKRISLNFKDADLKDVFRLFHEITGYNIVLDPAVAGTLTIVLENVPEDQALDIILKNNGLDKVFENNVIRIATSQKLAAEAASRKALIEAQQLEEEPITFTRGLSYAKAKDVTPILKKIMSKRGDVIMDDRTNTLIITDLRDRQDPINRLIDALDEQTPQVVIEARIVETDREFERDMGIVWGAHAAADQAHGTQTNLQFPHRATLDYDVSLPSKAGAGTLGMHFGNVLDSLTLDVTLQAFETNGDVKVLSSPRIATQNNQKATIEQGVQIPVVSTTATQINVEFISASLKLAVTPQITKEGTVIMDVAVDNSSPDFVNRVGDVPPIITERAQTQILVADGGTAVIGGIFKLNDSVTQASVPGLSKIPGLGWLFKNKTINRKNTELLIFITPRVTKKAEPQQEDRG
jgi:type IV pilus assembly protein PilQ